MIITGSGAGYGGQASSIAPKRAGVVKQRSEENPAKDSGSGNDFSSELLGQFLREKKEEILARVRSGETEPKIQIGAAAYTQKEWRKLLEAFDGAEDEKKKLLEEMRRKWAEKDAQNPDSD